MTVRWRNLFDGAWMSATRVVAAQNRSLGVVAVCP